MPDKLCECGCGATISGVDKRGRIVHFKKGHKRPPDLWTFDSWDSGRIINKSGLRMLVYRPDYPKASPRGEALRSHIVWWLTHGEVVPDGYVIHHGNEKTLDDRPTNLAKMTDGEHSRHHHEKSPPIQMYCAQCGEKFTVKYNVISQRLKEGRKHGQRFCSPKCGTDFKKGKRGKSYRGLTVDKVRQIKAARRKKISVADLAIHFGVSKSAIYAIDNGQNWSDVK